MQSKFLFSLRYLTLYIDSNDYKSTKLTSLQCHQRQASMVATVYCVANTFREYTFMALCVLCYPDFINSSRAIGTVP